MTSVLGSAAARAAAHIVNLAMPLAAQVLDCDTSALVFSDGLFLVSDTNRSVAIEDLVRHLARPGQMHQLNCSQSYETDGATYPYGCHIVEVEIDKATCAVQIARYSVMDDFGLVINPMTLAGQIHGGIAQGVGQALLENVVYDSLVSFAGSLMDYALPRADHFSLSQLICEIHHVSIICLALRGLAGGAIGAPQAVISAVCDALQITHIDMPATSGNIQA